MAKDDEEHYSAALKALEESRKKGGGFLCSAKNGHQLHQIIFGLSAVDLAGMVYSIYDSHPEVEGIVTAFKSSGIRLAAKANDDEEGDDDDYTVNSKF